MPPFATVFLFSLLILLSRVTKSDQTKKGRRALLPLHEHIKEERGALLSFYKQVGNTETLCWDESEFHCSWKGVSCDPINTTVIQLLLPGKSLFGAIPQNTIGNLSNLLVLSLRFNSLKGSIPSDFSDLVLSELRLDGNSLTGGLENINADELEKLNVSNNAFDCFIPRKLSRFSNTSFLGNKNLCGYPLHHCSWDNKSICWDRYYKSEAAYKRSLKKPLTVGISVALGLPLLIMLCCLRKKICHSIKQPSNNSLEGHTAISNKFGDGSDSFDWDELLRPSVEVLGKGSVGTSYKRVLEEKNMTLVLKRLENVTVLETEFKSLMEVLMKIRNENVVPVIDYYFCSNDVKWLVYDFMSAGSLSAHLHGTIVFSGTRLDWDHRKRIALSAARGVAYLHLSNNIIHGNIKSSNVFLQQETKDATVSDYGLQTLSGWWSSPNHWVTGYCAPEVLKTQTFSFKSDVYSFGVLLLELLTGKDPNQASAGEVQIDFPLWVQSVVHEEPKVESFDVELRRDPHGKQMFQMLRIAKDCVSIVPDQRPQMQEVVSMIEEINRVQTDDWVRQSEGYDNIHLD